jgi:hypothetical protein
MALHNLTSYPGPVLQMLSQAQVWFWLKVSFASIVVLVVLDYLRVALRRDLRNVPGPIAARFTRFHRVLEVASGQIQQREAHMHKMFGPVVRLGPNFISISDPAVIPELYGFNAKYLKVLYITRGFRV